MYRWLIAHRVFASNDYFGFYKSYQRMVYYYTKGIKRLILYCFLLTLVSVYSFAQTTNSKSRDQLHREIDSLYNFGLAHVEDAHLSELCGLKSFAIANQLYDSLNIVRCGRLLAGG